MTYADVCGSWVSWSQWGLSQSAVTESTLLGPGAHTKPPVEQPQLRNRRSTKWRLEVNTAYYGQEKLWVNIAIYLNLSLSPFVSLTPQKLQPLMKEYKDVYILIKKCCCSLLQPLYNIVWFGAEGQFMPTWHDFEPEVKPRQSRKWPMMRLADKEKRGRTNEKRKAQ